MNACARGFAVASVRFVQRASLLSLLMVVACSSPASIDGGRPDAAESGDAAVGTDGGSGFECAADECFPEASYCYSIFPEGCTSLDCVEVAECRAFPAGCTDCDCVPRDPDDMLRCTCVMEGSRVSYSCER